MKEMIRIVSVLIAATISVAAQGTSTSTASPSSSPSITADQLARLERAENRLKDWPNLARYRDANVKLAPPAKGENRVVFMGTPEEVAAAALYLASDEAAFVTGTALLIEGGFTVGK